MKKILSLLLIFAMVFTFVACGNNGNSEEEENVTLVLGNMAYTVQTTLTTLHVRKRLNYWRRWVPQFTSICNLKQH